MNAEIFSASGLIIVLFVLVLGVGGLAVTIWAIVDAATKPTAAFGAAGSSKAMWITLIVVFYVFTWIVGIVLAIVYLAAIRPKVRAAELVLSQQGITAWPQVPTPPPTTQGPPPGWYADAQVPGQMRWWDGTTWTAHVQPPGT